MLFTAVNHRNHTFRINIVGAYINRGGATVDATTVQWRRSPSINYSIADKVVRTRPHPDVPAEGDGRHVAVERGAQVEQAQQSHLLFVDASIDVRQYF